MATPTLTTLEQRYLDLIGDSDGTIDDFGIRNINASIQDILNRYQFSWNVTSATLVLSAGSADLPNNFNPLWGIIDAKIGDTVLSSVSIESKDSCGDNVYWITYNTSTDVYTFNSKTQTGTVTIFYNFSPADLSGAADVCIVPDAEAVSYLAASKNWIGAERDVDLKAVYEKEADRLITALWVRDIQNGPILSQGSVVEYNEELM